MTEIRVYTLEAIGRIPWALFSILLTVSIITILLFFWKWDIKVSMRRSAILLLVEWLFLVFGIAVIFRGNSVERSINIVPLSSYFDYGEHSYLMEKIALNILNVVLFIPVGLLLGCGFREMTWKKVLTIGAILSFSIELLQLIFSKGLCEVDDVIHNVLGCIVGYGLYKIVAFYIMNVKFGYK